MFEHVIIMLIQYTKKTDRSVLAKIRVSAHDLAIDKGRYIEQLRKSRICLACDSGSVEDEYHFLLSCVAYETLHKYFISKLHSMSHMFV